MRKEKWETYGFWLVGVGKGLIFCGLVAWLFYKSAWGMLLSPVFLAVCIKGEVRKKGEREKARLQQLFAEWLGFLKEALQVGYALERAVGEAKKSMLTTYKEEEPFLEAVTGLQRKMQLGMSVEEAFAVMAKECDAEEIAEFSEVLFIAKRSGGAVGQVITNTERIIHEKQETMRHIHSVLHSREYELRLMKTMPFAMLLYLRLFMPDFLTPLYQNAVGTGIMTVFLLIYAGLGMVMNRISCISV